MKKRFSILISVLLICAMLLSFASANEAADSSLPAETLVAESENQGHYVFQPKACSVFMKEVFGEAMCETWENLVDAVLAGENTFACPDKHTYDWVMGQFPRLCFPVLTELIDYAYERGHCVKNGVASFTYLVSREEASARIAEFAAQIEGILNEVLRDDDSDFEKALALYEYFCRTYVYDWDTYEKMQETYLDYTTTLRLFRTGKGICCEIAPAYSYLLLQAGVEATVMTGDNHQWSYVRIDGCNYHIDPTFVISSDGSLAWLMMTDEQRAKDGYVKGEYFITSNYSRDHDHPDYSADDGTYSAIWNYSFGEFFPEENILSCRRYTEGWETVYFDFAYGA